MVRKRSPNGQFLPRGGRKKRGDKNGQKSLSRKEEKEFFPFLLALLSEPIKKRKFSAAHRKKKVIRMCVRAAGRKSDLF